jgi:nitroreductase
MRTNASARAFTGDPVPDGQLYRILDSARFAPSGGNKQGWHVIVLKDPAVRSAIGRLARMGWNEYATLAADGQRPFAADETGRWPGSGAVDLAVARTIDRPWPFMEGIENVPALLVVAVDLRLLAATDVELDRTQLVAGGSIYPFCQNILLAARGEDLGGVMTTFVVRQEPEAQRVLGLPKHLAIAAMIALTPATGDKTRAASGRGVHHDRPVRRRAARSKLSRRRAARSGPSRAQDRGSSAGLPMAISPQPCRRQAVRYQASSSWSSPAFRRLSWLTSSTRWSAAPRRCGSSRRWQVPRSAPT